MTHHSHHIFHISSYPNLLEDTDEYVKALLHSHWLSEWNEVVIGVKEHHLIRHHIFEAFKTGLVLRSAPNLVVDNRIYHNTLGTLEGVPEVTSRPRHQGYPTPIVGQETEELGDWGTTPYPYSISRAIPCYSAS